MSTPLAVSLVEKFAQIHEHWRPKLAAELAPSSAPGAAGGWALKLVKAQGTFPWHHHEHEDELFLVHRGEIAIEFRTHTVRLRAGEFCHVPKGVEHRSVIAEEAEILLFEPAATRNTGNVTDAEFTAPNGVTV